MQLCMMSWRYEKLARLRTIHPGFRHRNGGACGRLYEEGKITTLAIIRRKTGRIGPSRKLIKRSEMHKTDHKDGGTTIKGVKGSDTCRKSTGASHDSGLAMAGKFPSLADPSEKEAVTYGPGGDPSESDDADEEEEEEDDGADGNSEVSTSIE